MYPYYLVASTGSIVRIYASKQAPYLVSENRYIAPTQSPTHQTIIIVIWVKFQTKKTAYKKPPKQEQKISWESSWDPRHLQAQAHGREQRPHCTISSQPDHRVPAPILQKQALRAQLRLIERWMEGIAALHHSISTYKQHHKTRRNSNLWIHLVSPWYCMYILILYWNILIKNPKIINKHMTI